MSRKLHILLLSGVLLLQLFGSKSAGAATFLNAVSMPQGRGEHTTTLLQDGTILVAGGFDGTNVLSNAELYNPLTGAWTVVGSMNTARQNHTATLLPNGKVLVAGGIGNPFSFLPSSELFDPATRTWTATTGSMSAGRADHGATLLPNGKVLVEGGSGSTGGGFLTSAELYDPATDMWTTTGSMGTRRSFHTVTLLPDGQVLAAGGTSNGVYLANSELYNPTNGLWTPTTGNMNVGREQHTATLLPSGQVLVAGGFNANIFVNNSSYLSSVELYNPSTQTWSLTNGMASTRGLHTASLLPNGEVLVSGGIVNNVNLRTNGAELYDPGSGTWTPTSSLNVACDQHTATVLPDGRILILGGFGNTSPLFGLTHAELYDWAGGTWSTTGHLNTPRTAYAVTLLTNGNALVVGGQDSSLNAIASTELYYPVTGTWSNTGPLNVARVTPTVTLLRDGRVLATGGSIGGFSGTTISSTEIYDPNTGVWTLSGSMAIARNSHTATLLSDGRVLVAGGGTGNFSPPLTNCEVFDPMTGTWTPTGSLNTGRSDHAAVLLRDGTVLVAAGSTTSSEIYVPSSGKWFPSGTMFGARAGLSLIPMPSGNVLAVGGDSITNLAEMWNFPGGNWTPAGFMSAARSHQAAALLSNGKVLVAGGFEGSVITNTAELYDPALNTWTLTGSMSIGHYDSPMVFLPSGKVLEAGFSTSELYSYNLGFNPAWQPQIGTMTSPIVRGANLALTGTQFRGISEASGGNTSQDSSSDAPLVQLRSIEGGQWFFFPAEQSGTKWSSTNVAVPETLLPAGNALLTMFVNGIPSTTAIVDIVTPAPIPFVLTNVMGSPGAFQFQFTNVPFATFTVLSATNVTTPLSNWTPSGFGVNEISPGHFQFIDPQGTTNGPQRFYIARSP